MCHQINRNSLLGFEKNKQYAKFCAYGFLKNLRFFDAFLLIYILDNEMTFAQAGMLYASREIISNIFEIPSGIIADSYGRKNSLIGAFILYILSFIFFYCATNFELLLIAMLLIGIGDAFRSGTHKGMIMDYLRINGWGEHKITYYGYTRSWSQLGSALSALLAGIIVFYSGDYRIIYLASIVPYLINFINIYSYPEALNFSLKKEERERKDLKGMVKNIFNTLRKKQVFEIVNSSALHSSFLKSIKDYIQPIMVSIAVALPILTTIDLKSKSGLIIGIIYSCIFILNSYASKMSGKLSLRGIQNIEKKTLLFGIFSGVLCGVFFYCELFKLSIIVFIFIYIVENLRKPILTGYLSNNVPDEILTSVISVQSFYKTLVTAILSILIGILADCYGIGISLLVISILLLLLTLLIGDRKIEKITKTQL